MIRWLIGDYRGRRAFQLSLREEARGNIAGAQRWMRKSNRLFRLLRDGGNPWRDGPVSRAVKEQMQDYQV